MLRYVRNIDANWIEGVNIHGQTGIFPKMYVHEAHEADLFADSEAVIPDRPKTPRMSTAAFRFVFINITFALSSHPRSVVIFVSFYVWGKPLFD